MFQALRQIFTRGETRPAAAIPPGQRVYDIGDIHGRLDLFEALVEAVEADDASRAPAQTTVVLLGDLVDRGPGSAGVIELAREWQARASGLNERLAQGRAALEARERQRGPRGEGERSP